MIEMEKKIVKYLKSLSIGDLIFWKEVIEALLIEKNRKSKKRDD